MGKARLTPVSFDCKQCGTTHPWRYSSTNSYCDNRCQQAYEWEHVTKPQILAGEGADIKTLYRFLAEAHGERCATEGCPVSAEWKGKPIRLHVDHIDGNSDNNKVDNIRLLCPNCHSQTPTWCGRNKDTKRNRYIRSYYSVNKEKWGH